MGGGRGEYGRLASSSVRREGGGRGHGPMVDGRHAKGVRGMTGWARSKGRVESWSKPFN
jgi:hypothetical protein